MTQDSMFKPGIRLLAGAGALLALIAIGVSTPAQTVGRNPLLELKSATTQATALKQEIERLHQPWSGDLDGIAQRGMVRLLTPLDRTFYYFDGPRDKGLTCELAKKLEESLKNRPGGAGQNIRVVIVPMRRDQLVPALLNGRGDVIAYDSEAPLDVTRRIAYASPLWDNVRELVVTGPNGPAIARLEDLAGKTLYVRNGSEYIASLNRLNESFAVRGLPPVLVFETDPQMEDEELLAMVNAGLIPMTIMDSHKAIIWEQVLTRITVHHRVSITSGKRIAWAVRADNPALRAEVDRFSTLKRAGMPQSNAALVRLLKQENYVTTALTGGEREKFRNMVGVFRQYGERYEVDWLYLLALAYRESTLVQSSRSRTGAVGVMQIKPETARYVAVTNITNLNNNVHAGAKYVRYILDKYLNGVEAENTELMMLACLGYRVGPNRMKQLQDIAAAQGLDPNAWYQNVELVVARLHGHAYAQYIRHIHQYYTAYRFAIQGTASARAG